MRDFKKLLLAPSKDKNEIDDPARFPNLRERFQSRRNGLLRTGKTISGRLMLSLLPYWVLFELYGKRPQEVDATEDTEPLHRRITSRTEAERKIRLASARDAEEITLAEPDTPLAREQRGRVEQTTSGKGGGIRRGVGHPR